jgi:hypothetical protein
VVALSVLAWCETKYVDLFIELPARGGTWQCYRRMCLLEKERGGGEGSNWPRTLTAAYI